MGLRREGHSPFCAGRSRPRAAGPSPTLRFFFPAAPQVLSAPLSLCLLSPHRLLSASPCSRASVALSPWPPARGIWPARGGVGFGRWRLVLRPFQGLRVPGFLVSCSWLLRPVSCGGVFRLHCSAAREELGMEDDGWQSSGPSESRGRRGSAR